MSSYSIDTLENLLFETTGQCDLVLRRIMRYISSADILQIKAELTEEWRQQYEDEHVSEEDFNPYEDDFHPYEPEDDED